jgi:dGTPase
MNYASAINTLRKDEISIAPFGIRANDSKGRKYPEEEHAFRTCFQRDKDRIIHTTAFRRLEYKTQVFINDEGDYYRTRLTHTLEVAQIGRTLARALGANEDLVEAICLAHDMGHPPFGHSGEATLARLMIDSGSFNHNHQTLRIVTKLEKRYTGFDGLNLCYETLEGIAKHETEYDYTDIKDFNPDLRGHLEAQIANIADEAAYSAHDLDDGLRSGLITVDMCEDLLIWKTLADELNWIGPKLTDLDRHRFSRALINQVVTDAFYTTQEKLLNAKVQSVDELQRLPYNVVGNSESWLIQNRELKDFLFSNLYRHYRVVRMSSKANMIITRLFEAFRKEPTLLPKHIQSSIEERGTDITICDYIAGMTDRYAIEQYQKLFEPSLLP